MTGRTVITEYRLRRARMRRQAIAQARLGQPWQDARDLPLSLAGIGSGPLAGLMRAARPGR